MTIALASDNFIPWTNHHFFAQKSPILNALGTEGPPSHDTQTGQFQPKSETHTGTT